MCPTVTDEISLNWFKTPSNISPAKIMPRVGHLNNQDDYNYDSHSC